MGSKCAQRKIGVILAFFLGIYYIRLQDIRDSLTQILNFFLSILMYLVELSISMHTKSIVL